MNEPTNEPITDECSDMLFRSNVRLGTHSHLMDSKKYSLKRKEGLMRNTYKNYE